MDKAVQAVGSVDISDLAERFFDRWDRIEVGRQNELLAFEVDGIFPTNYSMMHYQAELSGIYYQVLRSFKI